VVSTGRRQQPDRLWPSDDLEHLSGTVASSSPATRSSCWITPRRPSRGGAVITLGEWHVVVDVPDDFAETEADDLSAMVLASLAEWAIGTELRFSTSGRQGSDSRRAVTPPGLLARDRSTAPARTNSPVPAGPWRSGGYHRSGASRDFGAPASSSRSPGTDLDRPPECRRCPG